MESFFNFIIWIILFIIGFKIVRMIFGAGLLGLMKIEESKHENKRAEREMLKKEIMEDLEKRKNI